VGGLGLVHVSGGHLGSRIVGYWCIKGVEVEVEVEVVGCRSRVEVVVVVGCRSRMELEWGLLEVKVR